MICQNDQELMGFVESVRELTKKGKVASYIPALEKADPSKVSIAIYGPGGRCHSAGDVNERFTLQSVSKILTLALAIMDWGEDHVFNLVGMEPTGDPFNSIAKLETMKPSKPLNPMINAGALTVSNMIKGNNANEKFERLLTFVKEMTNNPNLTYSEEVAKSENETAFLNRSLCYFLKQHGAIEGDIEELMDLYTKQCSITVNCRELARIGAVLACNGVDPDSGRSIIPPSIARICKTFMVTCGMYNASGEFAIKVGIPAKSGVSGAILGAIPGKFGIGIYSPALDEKGNSVAGVKLLELLSEEYNLNMF